MDDNRRNLYDQLTKDNYDLGTYDQFNEALSDSKNRHSLFDAISDKYDVGTFDDFDKSLGFGVQEQQQQQQPQQSVQAQQPVQAQTPQPTQVPQAPRQQTPALSESRMVSTPNGMMPDLRSARRKVGSQIPTALQGSQQTIQQAQQDILNEQAAKRKGEMNRSTPYDDVNNLPKKVQQKEVASKPSMSYEQKIDQILDSFADENDMNSGVNQELLSNPMWGDKERQALQDSMAVNRNEWKARNRSDVEKEVYGVPESALSDENSFKAYMDEERRLNAEMPQADAKTDDDIFTYYQERFANTEDGKKAIEARDKAYNEYIDKEWVPKFQETEEYKSIMGKQYKTQAEVDEANKKLQESFNNFIKSNEDAVNNGAQGINDAYNKAFNDRYGKRITKDAETLYFKNLTKDNSDKRKMSDEQIQKLQEDINKRMREIEKQKQGFSSKVGYRNEYYRSDKEFSKLEDELDMARTINKLLTKTDRIVQAVNDGDQSFFHQMGKALTNEAQNVDNWTFGISELIDNARLNSLLEKANSGESLTDQEKQLLDAAAMNMALEGYYRERLNRGYTVGETTAVSLPFMLEFIANPIASSGNAIAKGLLNYALKGAAKGAVKSAIKAGGKTALKIGANLAGQVGAATATTFTSGLAGTTADALRRLNQNYVIENEDGDIVVNKLDENDPRYTSEGEAFGKAATTRTFENLSEMIWNPFRRLVTSAGRAGITASDFNRLFGDKAPNSMARAWRWLDNAVYNNPTLRTVMERAQFHGLPEEYAEEVVNNLMNVGIGEMSIEDAINLDNNIDTFMSLVPTSVLFGAIGVTSYAAERKQLRDMKKELLGRMDSDMKKRISALEQLPEYSGFDDIGDQMRAILMDNSKGRKQKKEALTYLYYTAQERAMAQIDAEKEANANGTTTVTPEQEAEAERQQEERDAYNGSAEQPTETVQEQPQQQIDPQTAYRNMIRAERAVSLAQTPEERTEAENALQQAQQAWQPYAAQIEQGRDQAAQQADQEAKDFINAHQNENGELQAAEHGTDGNVYIKKGNLVMKPDGEGIDIINSDDVIYYTTEDGRVLQARSDMFKSVAPAVPSEDYYKERVEGAMNDYTNQQDAALGTPDIPTPQEMAQAAQNGDPNAIINVNGQPYIVDAGTTRDGNVQLMPIDAEGEVDTSKQGIPMTAQQYYEMMERQMWGVEAQQEMGTEAATEELAGESAGESEQPAVTQAEAPVEEAPATEVSEAEAAAPAEQPTEAAVPTEAPAEEMISPEEQERRRRIAIEESLPKDKNGEVDLKKLTPAQQYDYTEINDGKEVADQDLLDNIAAAQQKVAKEQEKVSKAIGTDRLIARKNLREAQQQLAELQALQNEKGVQSAEQQQAVQEQPIQEVEQPTAEVQQPTAEVQEETPQVAQPVAQAEGTEATQEEQESAQQVTNAPESEMQSPVQETQPVEAATPQEEAAPQEAAPASAEAETEETQPTEQEYKASPIKQGESAIDYAERIANEKKAWEEKNKDAKLKVQDEETSAKPKANDRKEALRARAMEWEKKVGVPVKIIERVQDVPNAKARRAIKRGARVTGWFEPSTGEVCIYLPNNKNQSDIDKTYLHEVVAHKGLRKLLGNDKFNELCDSVWNWMSAGDRNYYTRYVLANDSGISNETELRRAAADEYMAGLAEEPGMNPSVWEKVISAIKEIFHKIGFNVKVNDNDIAYILNRSYNNLVANKGVDNQVNAETNGQMENGEAIRFSVSSIMEGAGFDAAEIDDEGNKTRMEDAEGNVIIRMGDKEFSAKNPVTVKDLEKNKNSILNTIIGFAIDAGTVTKKKAKVIMQKYADIINTFLESGSAENGGFEGIRERWMWIGETVFKTVAKNSDAQYSYSLDITRVCKKNEAVIRTISALQKQQGYGATPAQIMDIYTSTHEAGYQVPCPVCYVFSRYLRNGKYASAAVNGMHKYGEHLPGGSKPWTVDQWEEELEKQEQMKERSKKEIGDANNIIATIFSEIDKRGMKLMSPTTSEEEKKKLRAEIVELDAQYRAALDIANQQSLTNWIKTFAIHSVDGKNVLYTDTRKPENIDEFNENALDIRKVADTMRLYPAIQRLRKSGGAAAGKEITFESNNELGELISGVGANKPEESINWFKAAADAKTPKERGDALKKAYERFASAVTYAYRQSLRGGQRMWSWSDNIESLSPDVAVNLMQLELLGGALQSYSKQLEGVALVASMDGYVNGSLMAKDNGWQEVTDDMIEVKDGKEVLKEDITETIDEPTVDGKQERTRILAQAGSPIYEENGKKYVLIFDDIIGIDPHGREVDGKHLKGLFDLSKEYDRAGNIIVGMNDRHVRAAMADDRIFFIIPWHSSGQSVHILKSMLGVLGTNLENFKPLDYTKMQEEKNYAKKKDGKYPTIPDKVVEIWESHKNENDFKSGIGAIESGHNGKVSASQLEYRRLRAAIFDGNIDKNPEDLKKVKKDEFLKQVYAKVKAKAGTMTNKDNEFVYPYEYWDESSTYDNADINGQRYAEYCRRLGVMPKFSGKWNDGKWSDEGNFIDDKGYWKLLIDRRMYDNNGNFQDLTPTDSEGFDPDLTDTKKNAEKFVPTQVATDKATQGIVDDVIKTEKERAALAGRELPEANYDMTMDDAVEAYRKLNGKSSTKIELPVDDEVDDDISEEEASDEDVRFRVDDYTEEEQQIIDKAKADGTYMKAPNGKQSKLNEKQWAQVRTNAFKKWFGDWEKSWIRTFLVEGIPVAKLSGNEFSRIEGKNLTEQVEEYFDRLGNKAVSPLFGDVILDRAGADDSLSHGMGRNKAIAYAAVKDVIEHGVLVESHDDHKGRGYSSVHMMAPITIGDERYACSVILHRNKKNNRFYLHEVTAQKNLQDEAFVTNSAQKPASIGDIAKVLKEIVTTKDYSKIIDENGEPLVVYHGSPSKEIDAFDLERVGRHTGAYGDNAIYATDSEEVADVFSHEMLPGSTMFTTRLGKKGEIYPLYMDIKNPFDLRQVEDNTEMQDILKSMPEIGDGNFFDSVMRAIKIGNHQLAKTFIDFEKLQELGYDGVIARMYTYEEKNDAIEYGAFKPNQLKSATENEGEFDKENSGIRFRVSAEEDKAYMDAVENGDMETAQKMVDAAAKQSMPNTKVVDADGNPLLMSHHTNNEGFYTFDKGKIGTGQGQAFLGIGFNFSRGYGSSTYGNRNISAYLNAENPLRSDGKTLSKRDIRSIILELNKKNGTDRIEDSWGSMNDAVDALYDYGGDLDVYATIGMTYSGESVDVMDAFAKRGYDSTIEYNDNGEIMNAVVFDSNQIKSADPVTYDEEGNVIPLSDRFNESNPDIRFRVSAEEDKAYMDAVENGDMRTAKKMVNEAAKLAMPNTKVVDADGNPLVVYHGGNRITEFAPSEANDMAMYGRAFYATPSIGGAQEYAEERTGDMGNVMPVYMNLENPFIEESLEEFGYPEKASDQQVKELIDALKKKGLKDDNDIFFKYKNGNISGSIIGYLSSAKYDGRERQAFNWWNASDIVRDTLIELGYDGVIGSYAGDEFKMPQVAAFESNQIKSADTITLDDGGNVIPLSERFDNDSNDIRFSIRGEVGAAAAKDSVAMENLDVAKKMDAEGKDAKAIWLATGWEKGKDGKWRNEIPDAKPKPIDPKKVKTIEDIIDAPELFASYPSLKEYTVEFTKLDKNVAASINNDDKTVKLDTRYNTAKYIPEDKMDEIKEAVKKAVDSGEIKSRSDWNNLQKRMERKYFRTRISAEGLRSILHEMQHAIQRIEGFAKGGSVRNLTAEQLNDARKMYPESATFAVAFGANTPKNLIVAGKDYIISLLDRNIANQSFPKEYMSDAEQLRNLLAMFNDREYAAFVRDSFNVINDAKKKGVDAYKKLSGEVEARNVERRSSMDEEGRRTTPPSETEDVKREEQEVRFRITPEEDAAYKKAFEEGNLKEVEMLFNEAAKRAGYTISAIHGTDNGGFTMFDPSYSDDGKSLFFSNYDELGRSYAGTYDQINIGEPLKSIQEAKNFVEENDGELYEYWTPDNGNTRYNTKEEMLSDWDFDENENVDETKFYGIEDSSGYTVADGLTEEEAMKRARVFALENGNQKGLYYVLLKMDDPLEIDADGQNWDSIYLGNSTYRRLQIIEDYNDDSFVLYEEKGDSHSAYHTAKERTKFATEEELLDWVENNYNSEVRDELKESYDEDGYRDSIDFQWDDNAKEKDYPKTTREISELARDTMHDSVIIHNVLDNGKYAERQGVEADVYIVFDGKQVKSANPVTFDDDGELVPLSERFNENRNDIRFRIGEEKPVFISNAQSAVESIKQDKATPQQWLAMLTKNGGIKAGEDKWLGLSDWLKDNDSKSLTKQEVLDYIRKNEIQVEDVEYEDMYNIYDNPRMKELRKEYDDIYNEMMDNQNSLRDEIETFEDEMYEKYGEGWVGKLNEDEQKRLNNQGEEYEEDIKEKAFEEMVDRYGDDFRDAFELDADGGLSPTNDWNGGLSDAAKYFLNTNTINDTRLQYTTEGLDNKKEIALVVPTIESWNEDDNIHFGDAGEGRAVAWIRFGDTTTNLNSRKASRSIMDDLEQKYGSTDDYDKMSDEDVARRAFANYLERGDDANERTSKTLITFDVGEERAKNVIPIFEKLVKDHANGERVLVIDEIQSKRHQEGREKGYKTKEPVWEYDSNIPIPERERYSARRIGVNWIVYKDGEPEAQLRAESEEEAIAKFVQTGAMYESKVDTRIPDAPFDKNWHELAMKRMLRYAAENGYDKVAWTKGAQQADRYSLSKTIPSITRKDTKKASDKGIRIFEMDINGEPQKIFVNNDGTITNTTMFMDEVSGKPLSDFVGKEIAVKMMTMKDGETIDTSNEKVGGEGMKGFYDEILPRYMNKYGKKWGVKVGEVELPNVEEAGRTMWSVDVTPEMRESVMEGQPLFRIAGDQSLDDMERTPSSQTDNEVMAKAVAEMGAQLGEDVVIVRDDKELPASEDKARKRIEAGQDVKGWYSPRTKKVYVYLPNVNNVNDAKRTLLHEVVGHKGLRDLLGEQGFWFMLDNIWSNLPDGLKRDLTNSAIRNYNGSIYTALDEYLAEQAERDVVPSWWDRVVSAVRDALRKFGISIELTDKDVQYLLWRSRQNLKPTNPVVDMINDIAMRSRTSDEYKQKDADDVSFRIAPDDIDELDRPESAAQAYYERSVNSRGFKFTEAWQDSMLGLKKLMQAIEKGGEKIKDFENPYLYENAMSSINLAEIEAYKNTLYKDLLEAINALKKEGATDYQVKEYMMAKHGLERNEFMAKREAQKARDKFYNNRLASLDEAKRKGQIDQDKYDMELAKLDRDADAKYQEEYAKNRERDYAGLTALTGEDATADAENAARMIVDDFENAHDTTDLWEKTNAATKAQIEKLHESGLIDKAGMDEINGMYEYYIPLRGWDEVTAMDKYTYFDSSKSKINSPIKNAKGRKSLADDPIATIGNMAESAIVQGNRNQLKLRMLTMALNHPSDLLSVNRIWLRYDDATDTWVEQFPDIPKNATASEVKEIMEAHEEKMKQLSESDPEHYRQAKKKDNIPYKIVNPFKNEHQILVKRNGEDFVITVNGNPRAAQAMNGLTNPESNKSDIAVLARWIRHNMAANFTSRNPAFVLANFMRDSFYTNSMVHAKEDNEYAMRYHRNWAKAAAHMAGLVNRYKKGKLDMSNPLDAMFNDFISNGGETGYTFINSVEDYKNTVTNAMKKMNRGKLDPRRGWALFTETMDTLGRWAEDTSRFAAFMTSREEGRSMERSIWDAKDISVNFNKKGAGNKASGEWKRGNILNKLQAAGAQSGRELYIFWNAAMQSLSNIGRITKDHPLKAAGTYALYMAAGALIPIAMQIIGEATGDGDDDYYNVSEYTRRTNLMLGTDKNYISLPLPIELRVFYGLGGLAAEMMMGKVKYTPMQASQKAAELMSGLLPIDLLGEGGQSFVPSYAKPFVEGYWTNQNFMGIPIYKDNDFNKDMPDWTKAYKSTSPEMIAMAKVINDVTGGNDYKKGKVDINPARVEHIMEGYFGGMATTANQFKNGLIMLTPWGEDLWEEPARNLPIVNRFIKQSNSRAEQKRINEEYFNNKSKMDILMQQVNGYKRDLQNPDKTDAEKESAYKMYVELINSKDYRIYEAWHEYDKALQRARKAHNEDREYYFKEVMNELFN